MPEFSQTSKDRLSTCDERLQRVFSEVIKYYDCTVLCGHRGEAEQCEAIRTGHSKLAWPNSPHNCIPSKAIDVIPYPVDWDGLTRFYHFAGFVMAISKVMGIKIRFGGDWDGDFNFREEKFKDLPHFELVD